MPGITLPIYSSPIAFPNTTIPCPSFILSGCAISIACNSPSNSIFIIAKFLASFSTNICAFIGMAATDDNFTYILLLSLIAE